jgi:hypothetical protein
LRGIIDRHFTNNPNARLIVLGDFNDVKDSDAVKEIIGRGKFKLTDTRPAERNGDNAPGQPPYFEPRSVAWTYFYGADDTYSRMDYILLSPALARDWVPAETYIPTIPNWGIGSDHRPIVAAFRARTERMPDSTSTVFCRRLMVAMPARSVTAEREHLRSNLPDKFPGFITHLGEARVFVAGRAIAQCTRHDRRVIATDQTENAVVFGGIDAFHRAGVHPEHGGTGQQVAEGNVSLARRPFAGGFAPRAVDDVAEHQVAVKIQRFGRNFADVAGALDKPGHVSSGHTGARSEHDKVRGVHNLFLVPRMRQQFGAFGWIVNVEKTIWLQAIRTRRQDERLLQSLPDIGGDLPCRVKNFCGIAPPQRVQQLSGHSVHKQHSISFRSEWHEFGEMQMPGASKSSDVKSMFYIS